MMRWDKLPPNADAATLRWVAAQLDREAKLRAGWAEQFRGENAPRQLHVVHEIDARSWARAAGSLRNRASRLEKARKR